MQGFVTFLQQNFVHIAPILVAGAFALLIVLERSKALIFSYPLANSRGFFEKIRDLVLADRSAEAIALCDRYATKPVAQIARTALLRAHQPEIMIEDGVALAVSEASERIAKRTQFLSTIANVSTLLGLLGTILGLIQSFEAVSGANPQMRASMLAAGISMAMNATMLGLAVAIPCMVAFSYLMNRTNRLNAELDQAAVRMLDIIRQYYLATEAPAGSGGGQAQDYKRAK